MKLKYIIFLVASGLFYLTCKHHPLLRPVEPIGPTLVDTTHGKLVLDTGVWYCFQRDILPLFQTNCAYAGCHDTITHEEGYRLNSYTNIMKKGVVKYKPNQSAIYLCLSSGNGYNVMPYRLPQLTPKQKNLIRQWILDGCKNDSCENSCDSTNFKYNADISPTLQIYCVGCHNPTKTSGGIDCSTYAGTSVIANNGKLMGAINHTTGFVAMPQGMPKLNECQIAQFRKWVAAGAPNN